MGWRRGGAPSMGSTVFWGLRPWTELERTPPSIQAKLPREPAPELLWASAGREGVQGVTHRLSCPSRHGALQALPSLISAEKHSVAAAAPARRVCRGPGAPSADGPVRLSVPSAPVLAPPQCPQSLCLQPGCHSRSEARAPQGPCRPGVTWLPGTGWREASHPGGGGPLPSGLPGLQPESQSSSPSRSPGGAAS